LTNELYQPNGTDFHGGTPSASSQRQLLRYYLPIEQVKSVLWSASTAKAQRLAKPSKPAATDLIGMFCKNVLTPSAHKDVFKGLREFFDDASFAKALREGDNALTAKVPLTPSEFARVTR